MRYVLRSMVVRVRQAMLARAVRILAGAGDAHRLSAWEIGPLAASLDAAGLERVRRWLIDQPLPPAARARMTAQDLRAAARVFLLVFASTLPVVLPFVVIDGLQAVERVSAAIAITMMFLCGYGWGRHSGLSPWRAGALLLLLGVAVQVVVIALGG